MVRLPASARILRADNGIEIGLGDLAEGGERPFVWSLDAHLRMTARRVTSLGSAGSTETFRLRLASGREVESTGEQRFRTLGGWVPLTRLAVGDRLATPRIVPACLSPVGLPAAEIVLLAHMIGDGSCVKRQPIRYASIDEMNLSAVTAAAKHFGITAIRDEYAAARVTTLRLPAPYRLARGKRNPIAARFDELGLFGLRSHEKFVPSVIFSLSNAEVAFFLHHLWATDGSVRWDATGRQGRIYYASTSRQLIDDVTQLLLRLGVHSRLTRATKPGYRDAWHLRIDGADNQTIFLRDIGVHGMRGIGAEQVLNELASMPRNTNVDTVPKEVWDRVRASYEAKGFTQREFQAGMGSQYCGSAMWKSSPSRARLARIATLLEDEELAMYATSDVFWDRIAEIVSVGEQFAVEVNVEGTHNLVTGGVFVHDSDGAHLGNSWCPGDEFLPLA